jgi:hypothetical protein
MFIDRSLRSRRLQGAHFRFFEFLIRKPAQQAAQSKFIARAFVGRIAPNSVWRSAVAGCRANPAFDAAQNSVVTPSRARNLILGAESPVATLTKNNAAFVLNAALKLDGELWHSRCHNYAARRAG